MGGIRINRSESLGKHMCNDVLFPAAQIEQAHLVRIPNILAQNITRGISVDRSLKAKMLPQLSFFAGVFRFPENQRMRT